MVSSLLKAGTTILGSTLGGWLDWYEPDLHCSSISAHRYLKEAGQGSAPSPPGGWDVKPLLNSCKTSTNFFQGSSRFQPWVCVRLALVRNLSEFSRTKGLVCFSKWLPELKGNGMKLGVS